MKFLLLGTAGSLVIFAALLRIDRPRFAYSCDLFQGRFIGHGYYNSPAFFPVLALWGYGLFGWMPERIRCVALPSFIIVMYMLSMHAVLTFQIPTWLTLYGIP